MNKIEVQNVQKTKSSCLDDKSINVIFKGLNKCNAGCTFCCIGDPGGSIIPWELFLKMISELRSLVVENNMKHITFTYHGGEPTLLKANLLKKMCEEVKTLPCSVTFNMQSNLISIPSSVKRVVQKHKIKIGTSIDPLGQDRLTQSGKSGFPVWLRTFVKYAKEAEPPGAIYVITRKSLGKEQEIYDICETIGSLVGQRFALQLNPIYSQGKVLDQNNDLSISAEEYGRFMVNFWRLWERNRRSISISPIQSFTRFFMPDKNSKGMSLACTYNGHCPGSHVGIDYNLNVAGCGRRLDSNAFIGNLQSDSLSKILYENPERQQHKGRVETLRTGECQGCDYFSLCHGGCPDDTWLSSGDMKGKTNWCESHKTLFKTMENEIRSIRLSASTPPSIPRNNDEILTVFLAESLESLPDSFPRRSTIWLLPDRLGKSLEFDSPLYEIHKRYKSIPLRIWCRNAQVTSLMMWEDLIQQRGVSVVLFEAEGLSKAMNILNSMNAQINLYIKQIVGSENNEHEVKEVLDRYISDPLWTSQIFPFSQMIRSYVSRQPIRLFDEFGLIPGAFKLKKLEGEYFNAPLISRIEKTESFSSTDWFLNRYNCTSCEYYRFCGGRFSEQDNGCNPKIKDIVSRLHSAASKMQSYMHERLRH